MLGLRPPRIPAPTCRHLLTWAAQTLGTAGGIALALQGIPRTMSCLPPCNVVVLLPSPHSPGAGEWQHHGVAGRSTSGMFWAETSTSEGDLDKFERLTPQVDIDFPDLKNPIVPEVVMKPTC